MESITVRSSSEQGLLGLIHIVNSRVLSCHLASTLAPSSLRPPAEGSGIRQCSVVVNQLERTSCFFFVKKEFVLFALKVTQTVPFVTTTLN